MSILQKLFEIPHIETPDGDLDMGLEFIQTPHDFVQYLQKLFSGEPVESVHGEGVVQIETPEEKETLRQELFDHPFFLMLVNKKYGIDADKVDEIIKKSTQPALTERKFYKRAVELFLESDALEGGLADNKTVSDIAAHHNEGRSSGRAYTVLFYLIKKEIQKGIDVEMEHTNDPKLAEEIAKDHLMEDPEYYSKLLSKDL